MTTAPAAARGPVRGSVRGLVLGKFLPPHRGHEYLIDFARARADHVTVHVCSTPADPVPGALRFAWMRDHFAGDPRVTVVHNDDPNPQTPDESPSEEEFYWRWRDSLLRHGPAGPPHLVFASEPYGVPLAACLGAEFVPVDIGRECVPASGTLLRAGLGANGPLLLPTARPYFARRVAVVGPESAGKSTLTRRLAGELGVPYAPEYARGYLAARPESWVDPATGANGFSERDVANILAGQAASVEALARRADRLLLLSDTEAVTTACWSRVLLGRVPDFVEAAVAAQRFDLYLVAAATDSWVDDGSQRVQPGFAAREAFERDIIGRLRALGAAFVVLNGGWEERHARARAAIDELLARPLAFVSERPAAL